MRHKKNTGGFNKPERVGGGDSSTWTSRSQPHSHGEPWKAPKKRAHLRSGVAGAPAVTRVNCNAECCR